MKQLLSLLAGGVALVAVSPASATNIVIQKTYDLTGASITSNAVTMTSTIAESSNLAPAQTIANGDTVDYSINFLGSQKITLTGTLNLLEYLKAVYPSNVKANETGTLTLLGSAASNGGTDIKLTRSSTNSDGSNIGLQFNGASVLSLPNSITFNGFRWMTNAAGVTFASGTSQDYNLTGFTVSADTATVSGVPETASWAMMLGGFGALGAVLRRSRRDRLAAA